MRVDPFAIALQVMSAVSAVSNLQPGERNGLPVVKITEGDKHMEIAITVSRDAPHADGTTHLPDSKG